MEETEPGPSFSHQAQDHLSLPSKEFKHYFPTTSEHSKCEGMEEGQQLEITNAGALKIMFESTANLPFWIKIKAEYLEITTKAVKTLLPFPTTYLCEAGFSAVMATETKLLCRLDIRNALRVTFSPITPRWDRLVAEK